jgi:hypothetical protein
MCKEECLYAEVLDTYISDLEILMENRNLKDMVFISNCTGRNLKSVRNVVPVRDYIGNKKDYSFVALSRYLKSLVRIKDVREKI